MTTRSAIKKAGLTVAALGIGVLAAIGAVSVGSEIVRDPQGSAAASDPDPDPDPELHGEASSTPSVSSASESFEEPETSQPTFDPPTIAASDAAFVANFDGEDSSDFERFSRGVWHRDDTVVSMTSWTGDHDETCGNPASQRPIQRDRPEEAFYTCRDHMMTSVGDTSGYSIAWFSPDQLFNGQTTVSLDVNSTNLGLRQWWEVSLVPADYNSNVEDCELCVSAASAVSTFFPTVPDNTFVFGLQGGGQRIMVDYENAPRTTPKLCNDADPIDPEGCDSKPIRRTWTAVDNGNGTVTVSLPELGHEVTMDGSFPDGDWRLVIKDHNYTPTKDGFEPVGFTWHWDNIIVA